MCISFYLLKQSALFVIVYFTEVWGGGGGGGGGGLSLFVFCFLWFCEK